MEEKRDWDAELERLAAAAGRTGCLPPPQGATSDDAPVEAPSSVRWDSRPGEGRWLADGQLASTDGKVDWRIEGWVARQGTSVWFGAGSTGKTQLMLWMAAMVASRTEDRTEHVWLGGTIQGTGHVLVLTAEDTREQIMTRLGDVLKHSMGQDEAARRRTLGRLHVMPFLSMSEGEFRHPSPSLMEYAFDRERDQKEGGDRTWAPTAVMREVRRYVDVWNRGRPEADRIVGVVMDSATSMAGFDSLDAQATTNFFFYLGRLCERLRVFWTIIGHTPKVTAVPQHAARETAASRLRGVAMWTTAPRLTVEVRLAQEWRRGRKVDRENEALRDLLGERVGRENILVVGVAKANLQQACREERYLVRLRAGAFLDVTRPEDARDAVLSGRLDPDGAGGAGGERGAGGEPASAGPGASPGAAPSTDVGQQAPPRRSPGPKRGAKAAGGGRRKPDPATFIPGTHLVLETIRATYPADAADVRVVVDRIGRIIAGLVVADHRAALVRRAWGGGEKEARIGTVNWHFDRLVEDQVLRKSGCCYYLVGGSAVPT